MISKSQLRATAKWQAEHIERIEIKARKELCIKQRVAAAVAAGNCNSQQDYIIKAICEKLEKDGFSL